MQAWFFWGSRYSEVEETLLRSKCWYPALFYPKHSRFINFHPAHFVFRFKIISNKMEKKPVRKANCFSKRVFAKIFPIVFNIKIAKKTHKITCTTLFGNLYVTKLPFMNNTQHNNALIRIEIVSNTYISVSFVSLPPQVIS